MLTVNCEEKVNVGKYGLLWIEYIKQEYPKRYRSLVRFGELRCKAAEINEVAYELLDDIEGEWFRSHKPKNKNLFTEMYKLRTQAEEELAEVKKLRDELLSQGDGDYYLKEEVI